MKPDPANTQWQVDVAVACAKLESVSALLSIPIRKEYLNRGHDILLSLKRAGRLHANQDWANWFFTKPFGNWRMADQVLWRDWLDRKPPNNQMQRTGTDVLVITYEFWPAAEPGR